MPLVALAYNPQSGRHSQARLDALCAAFAQAGYQTQCVDSHSADLIALASSSEQLCVVGGDGTLRDVIARLQGQLNIPPVSIYPAGTINLVAREIGHPGNMSKFVRCVTGDQARLRAHYHGVIGGHPMVVCASVGPDSIAVGAVSEALKRRIGRFAYAAAFLKLAVRWPRHPLSVVADGQSYKCEAAFILKGRYFAGPYKISRDAGVCQPTFQLVLLPRARRRDYLRLMISAMIAPYFASANWIKLQPQTIEISGKEALPVQADGDVVANLPIKAVINPNPVCFV